MLTATLKTLLPVFVIRKPVRALFSALLLSVLALSAHATTTTDVPYIDATGVLAQTASGVDVTVIASNADITALGNTLTTGWYVITGGFIHAGTITVSGDVNLILADGSSLTVNGSAGNAGINVSGANRLTVYAQSTGATMGQMRPNGNAGGAGIGGGNGSNGSNGGTIIINGGAINADGGTNGAGIGGGHYGDGGTITINGGVVTAIGDGSGAGIGGGFSGNGGTISITGGTVEASGGRYAAGIGGGEYGEGGSITITGNANVTAAGGGNAGNPYGGGAGIGSGGSGTSTPFSAGNITINTTGTLAATGGASTSTAGSGAAIGEGGTTVGDGAAMALYTVTVSAGANGSIVPPPGTYQATGSPAFMITPNSGYAIASVTDNDADVTSLLAGDTYTLTNIAANHAVVATFASTDAGLLSVAGQTIATSGGTGTMANPITSAIGVDNSVAALALGDIVTADAGATAELFPTGFANAAGATQALDPGANHVYVQVTAEDGATVLYYDVTVTRALAALSSAAIAVTPPATGATPVTAASCGAGFVCSAITWDPPDNPFLPGVAYTAELTVIADTGYTLAGLTAADVTINGQALGYFDNDGTTITLRHTFPPTLRGGNAAATPVPTLNETMLALLALLLAGMAGLRRKSRR
ncbi:MAG: IPTL-CTERM sorting domain-containing protein [Burkholderiales bacterium]|jgi:hypothetical protein|nr:IPTL-CTERM sorting domain-containing protein [Burkholderiales bacterium]